MMKEKNPKLFEKLTSCVFPSSISRLIFPNEQRTFAAKIFFEYV